MKPLDPKPPVRVKARKSSVYINETTERKLVQLMVLLGYTKVSHFLRNLIDQEYIAQTTNMPYDVFLALQYTPHGKDPANGGTKPD